MTQIKKSVESLSLYGNFSEQIFDDAKISSKMGCEQVKKLFLLVMIKKQMVSEKFDIKKLPLNREILLKGKKHSKLWLSSNMTVEMKQEYDENSMDLSKSTGYSDC